VILHARNYCLGGEQNLYLLEKGRGGM
jgi:hypothetical protein